MMLERRKFVRVTGLKEAGYKIKGQDKPMQIVGVKNISLLGISLYIPDKLSEGTLLEIEVRLPREEQPILIEGIVIWQRTYDIDTNMTGIKFKAVDDAGRERLKKFISGLSTYGPYERRRFVRYELNTDIMYQFLNDPLKTHKGKAVDLSSGGMKLILDKRTEEGSHLKIVLILPGETEAIEIQGEVVWVHDNKDGNFSVGMLFTVLKEEDKDKIWQFIFRQNKQKGQA